MGESHFVSLRSYALSFIGRGRAFRSSSMAHSVPAITYVVDADISVCGTADADADADVI